ncbi:MAG: hypothetical protein ABIN58_09745 [candidate division WOR-3 bacterium]
MERVNPIQHQVCRWSFCRPLTMVGLVVVVLVVALPARAQIQTVRNRMTQEVFTGPTAIQDAIDDPDTQDNHVLLVGPGDYSNIHVTKAVRIYTDLKPRNPRPRIAPAAGHPVTVNAPGLVLISGFNIAVPPGETGVVARTPVIVENCVINGGFIGIFTMDRASINNNVVHGYTRFGIFADGPQEDLGEITVPAGTPLEIERIVDSVKRHVDEINATSVRMQNSLPPGPPSEGFPIFPEVVINNNLVDGSSAPGGVGIVGQFLRFCQVTENTVVNHRHAGAANGVGVVFLGVFDIGRNSVLGENRLENNTLGFAAVFSLVHARENVVQITDPSIKAAANAAGVDTVGEVFVLFASADIYIADTIRNLDEGILVSGFADLHVNNSLIENITSPSPVLGNALDFFGLGFGGVMNSVIQNNTVGINVRLGSTVGIHDNCIQGNTLFGVTTDGTGGTIGAVGNFWGAPDGPSGAGPGSGDAVSSFVDFSNFLTVCDGRNANSGNGDRGNGHTGPPPRR